MANNVRTYTIELGKVYNNGVECKNPIITVAGGQDVAIKCINFDACDYEVQVGPGVTQPCITLLVQCEDCGACPPEEKTYCFCDSIEDCQECEYCGSNGFCVQLCDPEDCINGTCVGCQDDTDCICNEVCQNGECGCPAGTTKNTVTGCCDECNTDSDCPDCDLCKTVNGAKTCVPRECIVGVVKLETCECVECNNSSDCGLHECCNANNECNCCPGFVRINGVCTYVPCQFDSDCDPCEFCDPLTGCQPIDCVSGVCNPATGSCEEPCDGDCPVGQGCLEGFCVDCSTLSCSGVISQCSQAAGCDCNGSVCEYVNCETSDCVDWVTIPPVVIPGTPVPGSGTPAPSFNVAFTQLGIVSMSGGSGSFLDYSITITETGGNSGAWSVEGTALGTGTSVTFKLSDATNVQWNNVGFEVSFVGASGQTGSIVIYNTNWFSVGNGITNDLFTTPANWVYDVQGSAVAPLSNGGSFTPGSLKLCPCGEDANIIGYSWTTVEGNLTVTFTPLSDGCVRATVQGCGIGEGTATIDCAGIETTLALPPLPFDYSGATCCDPLSDPDCNSTPGDGYGCTSLDPLTGEIALSNTNFVTGDGYGLFRGVFQPDSIGYTIPQWIRVARTVCWSVTGTVREASTFIPPVLQHLFHDVEYRNGVGCLRLGHTCDIKVANCKKVQAEACFEGCDAFTVTISDANPVFTATTSLGNNVQVSYAWSTNNGLSGTNSSFTIPTPNSGVTQITVVATLSVNGVICVASDSVVLTLDAVEGCTNPNACNYSEDATVDDGSCIVVEEGSYDCAFGFVPAAPGFLPADNPEITYIVTGGTFVNAPITVNQSLPQGTYTIGVRFDGVLECEYELVVPLCYSCSGDVCVASSPSNNLGFESDDCDESCGCSITITPYFLRPTGATLAKIYINATGGTGLHVVSIVKSGGGSVMFSNGTFAGGNPATSVDVCDGNYLITVSDNVCTKTANIGITGYDCANSALEFLPDTRCQSLGLGDGPCFDCGSKQVFYTFAGDACATSYTRKITNAANTITYGTVQVSGTTGQGVIALGVAPADGLYRVTITSNNSPACEISQVIGINCITPSSCDFDDEFTGSISYLDVGGDLQLTASFYLDAAGAAYDVQLIQMVGGVPSACTGGANGTIHQTVVGQIGVLGLNQTTFNPITMPVVTTCYKVKVTKVGDPLCTREYFVSVNPFILPEAPCSGSITSPDGVSVIYDNDTELLYVSWAFGGTSGDMTVKIYVSTTDVCDIDIDSLVIDSSGHGESGDGWFGPIPKLPGQAQCITVVVEDTLDSSCSDTVESEIPACECEVEVTDVIINSVDEELEITYTSRCTEAGNLTIDISGDATGSATDNTASTSSVLVTNTKIVSLFGLPSSGGTVNIELADDADIACVDNYEVVIPSNCVGCSQILTVGAFSGSSITLVRDSAANSLAAGDYDLSVSAERTALRTALYAGVVAAGGDTCNGASDISVLTSGIGITQDDSNFIIPDYAEVTNALWVGDLKAYFGDCGCENGRTCTYTTVVDFSSFKVPEPSFVTMYIPVTSNNGTYYHNNAVLDFGLISSETTEISPLLLAAAEDDLLAAIQASNCGHEVTSVSITYDDIAEELTVVVTGTNAGFGIVQTVNEDGILTAIYNEFTQSACA